MNVVLIDAFSQIFRCFFAITHLSNSKGEPTNAVFGFSRLLLGLEKDFAPEYGAMCFDCGKPDFRLAVAPDYKAGRPPMPENLALQLDKIRKITSLFGWQIAEEKNYEADDLIACFVKAVSGRGGRTAYISQDKDLSQLVSESVLWYAPDKKNSGFEKRGVAEVTEKFGVAPENIVDYLALLGDSSDNIPGVPGIGAKTAAKILSSGVSLDGIISGTVTDVPGLTPRLVGAVMDNKERLLANRKLIRLRTDLPERFTDIEKSLYKNKPDWQEIAVFFADNGLKSLLKEIPEEYRNPAVDGHAGDDLAELPLFAAEQRAESETEQKEKSGGLFQGTLF